MEIDSVAMVEAGPLLRVDTNLEFCKKNAMLVGNTPISAKYFFFSLPPEEDRYNRLLKSMFEAGCTPEFLDAVRQARTKNSHYVMFFD